jgi:integrase
MRRGEACALRWSDIDLDGATVTIDESVISAGGGAVVKPPKTRASIRTVAIDDDTIVVLRRLYEHQAQLARACSFDLGVESFVFSFEPGGATPPHPDAMSHLFAKVRDTADVASDIHLHSLRHFQATALDPVVPERQKQARLGWSTVHMARHYTDGIGAEDRKAAVHIGRLLSPELDQSPSESQEPQPADRRGAAVRVGLRAREPLARSPRSDTRQPSEEYEYATR